MQHRTAQQSATLHSRAQPCPAQHRLAQHITTQQNTVPQNSQRAKADHARNVADDVGQLDGAPQGFGGGGLEGKPHELHRRANVQPPGRLLHPDPDYSSQHEQQKRKRTKKKSTPKSNHNKSNENKVLNGDKIKKREPNETKHNKNETKQDKRLIQSPN